MAPKYTISETCLHIVDSYSIPKAQFTSIFKQIRAFHPKSKVWQRSNKSLRREWAVHNFLYSIHFKRAQTKDVDLDYPCDKPEWLYKIVGFLVWLFVK